MTKANNFGIKASIGRQRLSAGLDYSTVSDTKSARAGFNAIIRNYQKFINRVNNLMPGVLYDALLPTFEKSQEYCPVDTGALVESGYLEITEFRGKPRVEIGYGLGGVPEYAAKVHENMEYKHEAPTRAKWLQIALEEDAQSIQNSIISQLKV